MVFTLMILKMTAVPNTHGMVAQDNRLTELLAQERQTKGIQWHEYGDRRSMYTLITKKLPYGSFSGPSRDRTCDLAVNLFLYIRTTSSLFWGMFKKCQTFHFVLSRLYKLSIKSRRALEYSLLIERLKTSCLWPISTNTQSYPQLFAILYWEYFPLTTC